MNLKNSDKKCVILTIVLLMMFFIFSFFNLMFLYWMTPHTIWAYILNPILAIIFGMTETLLFIICLIKEP